MVSLFLFLHKIIPGQSLLFRRHFYKPLYFLHNYIIGFFLGYFNNRDLTTLNQRIYNSRPLYFSKKHNTAPLFEWEQHSLKSFFPPNASVLVTAVGGGREAYGLLKLNYKVTACEKNQKLREFGNAFFVDEKIDFEIQDEDTLLESLISAQQKFDGVIIGWGAYNHIKESKNRVAYLVKLSKLLKNNGVILVSFWSDRIRQNHFRQLSLKKIHTTANRIAKLKGNTELDYGDILMPEYYHFFNSQQVENELTSAGFELLHFNEDGYGNATGRLIHKLTN
jgi:hypothetical protein